MTDYKRITSGIDGYCKDVCFGKTVCNNKDECAIRKYYNRLVELENKLENGLAFDLTDKRQTLLVSREDNLDCPMIGISVTEEELKTLIDKGIVGLPF